MAAEWEALFEDFQHNVCYQRAKFQFLTLLSTADTISSHVHMGTCIAPGAVVLMVIYSHRHLFRQLSCVWSVNITHLQKKAPSEAERGIKDIALMFDFFFTGCVLSKVIFIVSWVGLIVETHMFKTTVPVPRQCTTLKRAPNLDRPDLKFICKMRKDFHSSYVMLFLEEQLSFIHIFEVGAGSAVWVRSWWWE